MDTNSIVTESFVAKEVIAIDPGKSNGGIVISFGDNKYRTIALKKLNDINLLKQWLNDAKEACKLPLIIIEKINTYPGDYNDIGRAYGLEKLKQHYAELMSVVKLSGINYIPVMPRSWQNYIGIYEKGEDYKVRKERYKDIASDWFPGQKVVGWNADAFLLVEFAKKKLKYEPRWIHNKLKECVKSGKSLF